MPKKDGLLSKPECERIVLGILRQYDFLRPPRIIEGQSKWQVRGVITTGEVFEMQIDRRSTAQIMSPTLSPCDPARVPEKIVPNYTTYGRGTYTRVRRNT